MAENAEEKEMPGEGREDAAESPHPAEPQSEAELEKLIDKELEDVGKEDGVRNSTIHNMCHNILICGGYC